MWEQAVYTFDEGGNTTYEICAVTNDTISGSPIETMVIFRNGSAISMMTKCLVFVVAAIARRYYVSALCLPEKAMNIDSCCIETFKFVVPL